MKRYAYILPLLLLTLGCEDADLKNIAKSMLVLSTAVGQLQTDTIAANKATMLSDEATKAILDVCARVNVAGKQADGVLRNLSKLDPASRKSVLNLLTPISSALDPASITFVAGIKDATTKQKIEGALILMRTSLSTIMLIVSATGG